jgi:hypothetical protein
MQPWTVRYFVRAVVSAVIAGAAIAGTIWVDNPYVKVAAGVIGALGAYLGVGAGSSQVEPFVGRTPSGPVEVPTPPADPEPVTE